MNNFVTLLLTSKFVVLDELVSLSEQHVVDCAEEHPLQNDFPTSFTFWRAVAHLTKVGSVTEKSYPFEGKKGICRQRRERIQLKFPRIRHVQPGDIIALETVLDNLGPVAIQMPSSRKYQFYSSGIFNHFINREGKKLCSSYCWIWTRL